MSDFGDNAYKINSKDNFLVDKYMSEEELTAKQSREKIVGLLKGVDFAINAANFSPDDMPDGTTQGYCDVVSAGIVWCKVHVGSSSSSPNYLSGGPIVFGSPVVFDTEVGDALTGVNPGWKRSEYKIVGKALGSYAGPGFGTIPILLEDDQSVTNLNVSSLSDADRYGDSDNGVRWIQAASVANVTAIWIDAIPSTETTITADSGDGLILSRRQNKSGSADWKDAPGEVRLDLGSKRRDTVLWQRPAKDTTEAGLSFPYNVNAKFSNLIYIMAVNLGRGANNDSSTTAKDIAPYLGWLVFWNGTSANGFRIEAGETKGFDDSEEGVEHGGVPSDQIRKHILPVEVPKRTADDYTNSGASTTDEINKQALIVKTYSSDDDKQKVILEWGTTLTVQELKKTGSLATPFKESNVYRLAFDKNDSFAVTRLKDSGDTAYTGEVRVDILPKTSFCVFGYSTGLKTADKDDGSKSHPDWTQTPQVKKIKLGLRSSDDDSASDQCSKINGELVIYNQSNDNFVKHIATDPSVSYAVDWPTDRYGNKFGWVGIASDTGGAGSDGEQIVKLEFGGLTCEGDSFGAPGTPEVVYPVNDIEFDTAGFSVEDLVDGSSGKVKVRAKAVVPRPNKCFSVFTNSTNVPTAAATWEREPQIVGMLLGVPTASSADGCGAANGYVLFFNVTNDEFVTIAGSKVVASYDIELPPSEGVKGQHLVVDRNSAGLANLIFLGMRGTGTKKPAAYPSSIGGVATDVQNWMELRADGQFLFMDSDVNGGGYNVVKLEAWHLLVTPDTMFPDNGSVPVDPVKKITFDKYFKIVDGTDNIANVNFYGFLTTVNNDWVSGGSGYGWSGALLADQTIDDTTTLKFSSDDFSVSKPGGGIAVIKTAGLRILSYPVTIPESDDGGGAYANQHISTIDFDSQHFTLYHDIVKRQMNVSIGGLAGKTAIVPYFNGKEEEYVALACVEAPEVRFEDIIKVRVSLDDKHCFAERRIDQVFLNVCEPFSICVVSAVPNRPIAIGASVAGDILRVEAASDSRHSGSVDVTVKISGIRLGCDGVRFQRHSKESMEKNERFYQSARL